MIIARMSRYKTASEVFRAALRAQAREEQEHEAKLTLLRRAIDEGDVSGIARTDAFGRVRRALKLPAKRANHGAALAPKATCYR